MRLEARSCDRVDCIVVKILVLVTAYNGENPLRRKHKVFLAMIVSWELVDPKHTANYSCAKGKHVNIHALST